MYNNIVIRVIKSWRYIMITIGRVTKPKAGVVNIRIDRQTPVGNPFPVNKAHSNRDEVCDKYEEWFKAQMTNKKSPVYKEIVRIYLIAKEQDVNLQCWCAPKRCHGDTIKAFLDKHL